MAITEVQRPALTPPPSPATRLLAWLTTTDHKKIGILYFWNSFAVFAIAGVFALLMRAELARPGTQFLSVHAYNQVFTLHGTLMIFLFIFPMLAGFGNYFVPLQIGALDMAFPRVNALSFWLLPVSALTILAGFLAKGGAAASGWTNYVPISVQQGAGEDLWIAGIMLAGVASILGAINFIVTILRLRAPGMTMMRLPIFSWATLATSLLVVLATPVITAGLVMLFADRRLGYTGVVLSFVLITALSFSVWAHHMFVTGQVELPFFSVTTELISIPTGVLFFNWLATMRKGKLRFEPPMLFALGFVAMFLIGGLDGVWMASPAM